jgi:hypothetical protein
MKQALLLSGNPSNEHIWDGYLDYLTENNYECHTIILPVPPQTFYSINDVVDIYIDKIKKIKSDPIFDLILMHDWGSVYGFVLLERNIIHSEKIVSFSVSHNSIFSYGITKFYYVYQVWACFLYLLSIYFTGLAQLLNIISIKISGVPPQIVNPNVKLTGHYLNIVIFFFVNLIIPVGFIINMFERFGIYLNEMNKFKGKYLFIRGENDIPLIYYNVNQIVINDGTHWCVYTHSKEIINNYLEPYLFD